MTLKKMQRTNVQGTCIYCGQKLTPQSVVLEFFCTRFCGMMFGATLARLGHRLIDKVES